LGVVMIVRELKFLVLLILFIAINSDFIAIKPDFFYNWLPVGQNRFFTGYRKASSSDDTVGVGN